MGTPAYVSGTAASTTTTTCVITRPTTTTAGYLLVAIFYEGSTSAAPTWTLPATWTKYTTYNASYRHWVIAWKRCTGSEPSTYTFKINTGSSCSGVMLLYKTVTTTSPFDTHTNHTAGSGTAITWTALTTAANNEMLVAFFGITTASATLTTPTGTTLREHIAGHGRSIYAFDHLQATAGTSPTYSATSSKSTIWVAPLFALKPSASSIKTGTGTFAATATLAGTGTQKDGETGTFAASAVLSGHSTALAIAGTGHFAAAGSLAGSGTFPPRVLVGTGTFIGIAVASGSGTPVDAARGSFVASALVGGRSVALGITGTGTFAASAAMTGKGTGPPTPATKPGVRIARSRVTAREDAQLLRPRAVPAK